MRDIRSISSLILVLIIMVCGSCGGSTASGVDRQASGFDAYGLNESARIFDGYYINNYSYRDGYEPWAPGDDAAYIAANPGVQNTWYWPWRTTRVLMKWNRDWPEEGGWITNHMWDSYEDGGESYDWNWFTKIVWVGPAPAGDDPYAGYRIWNNYATIQDVYNDPHAGFHGNTPIPGPNGFGAY